VDIRALDLVDHPGDHFVVRIDVKIPAIGPYTEVHGGSTSQGGIVDANKKMAAHSLLAGGQSGWFAFPHTATDLVGTILRTRRHQLTRAAGRPRN
jgi:hypothetical protein